MANLINVSVEAFPTRNYVTPMREDGNILNVMLSSLIIAITHCNLPYDLLTSQIVADRPVGLLCLPSVSCNILNNSDNRKERCKIIFVEG